MDRKDPLSRNTWLDFLNRSDGGTIFHNPVFLSYHHDKYDEHHLALYKGDTLYGIMPMAVVSVGDRMVAKSPYGASYGGWIFSEIVDYREAGEIIHVLIDYLNQLKVHKCTIVPPIGNYYRLSSDTLCFAMLERGFRCVNSDITSVVPLGCEDIERDVFTSRARNMARKALKSDVKIVERACLEVFWELLSKTYCRHGVAPTHSYDELTFLSQALPDDIYCDIAVVGDVAVAGIAYFRINEYANLSFYLCSDPEYRHTQALSLLVYESIMKSRTKGFKYFDFGTSSANMKGRESVFMFKESYGAVGVFRNSFEIEL